MSLDAKYATSLNSTFKSNLLFILYDSINVPDGVSTLVSVRSAVIPMSIYVINSYNNFISLTDTTATTTTLLIPEGNYNANTFTDYLNNFIIPYDFYFDTITNRFTIVNNLNRNFTLNSNSTIHEVMGFVKNTSYSSALFSLTSPFVCDFSGTNYLKVCSNFLTMNIDSQTGRMSNILLTIPLDEVSGGVSYYSKKDNYKTLISDKHIPYINLQFYDEDNNLCNFNNKNVFVQLQFDFVVTPPDITPPERLIEFIDGTQQNLISNE